MGSRLNPQHQQWFFLDSYTAQSSIILGKSWVSHDTPVIQSTEVLSSTLVPLSPKSNVVGRYGTLLLGLAGMDAQLQGALLKGHKINVNPPPC